MPIATVAIIKRQRVSDLVTDDFTTRSSDLNIPAKARERMGVTRDRSDHHRMILAKLWRGKRVFNHYHHDTDLILRTFRQE